MRHTKKWHLEQVTKAQQALEASPPTEAIVAAYTAAYTRGQLNEALKQARAAGASLDELKAARAAA